jgi:hypothetical protein
LEGNFYQIKKVGQKATEKVQGSAIFIDHKDFTQNGLFCHIGQYATEEKMLKFFPDLPI